MAHSMHDKAFCADMSNIVSMHVFLCGLNAFPGLEYVHAFTYVHKYIDTYMQTY